MQGTTPGRIRLECHKASNNRLQIVQPSENRQDATKDQQKHRDCILASDKDFLMVWPDCAKFWELLARIVHRFPLFGSGRERTNKNQPARSLRER
jgi:hypothetical protein